MNARARIRRVALLLAVVATLTGGIMLLSTPTVEAARCCKVMVCSQTPPYACWEECRTCPKFP